MARVRVGTSGWQYADWRGRFYPEGLAQARWFDRYSQEFDTVEINASFYRLPSETTVQGWRRKAPADFRYAAKGSSFTTHRIKIGGDLLPSSVEMVTGRLRGLGPSLDVVLWQLPPNLHRDVPRLRRFLGLLPRDQRHAVEFRHPSWVHDEVFEALRACDAAHVWISSTGMPPDTTRTAGFTYLRFHGLGEAQYRWHYADDELAPWVDAVASAAADGLDGYVYFNNDYEAHAIRNGCRFRELLTAC